jgi:L-lactate dehydrogenase complex protein LldG
MERDNLQRLLGRVAVALGRAALPGAAPEHPPTFLGYARNLSPTREDLVERFARELEALSGVVHRVRGAADACSTVVDLVLRYGGTRVLAWQPVSALERDVVAELGQRGIEIVDLDLPRSGDRRLARLLEIEGIAIGLTGARAALADTGSLVLTSGLGRARMASLLPPVHIALIRADDLYPTLPALLAANPGLASEGSNLVVITGPSRTADIEMTLTHGVHGPKHLHVVVMD